ncbi:MAG: lysyl oxidase family protein [Candidatus Limnocylindria bacterium]
MIKHAGARTGLALWLSAVMALLQLLVAGPVAGAHPETSVLPDLVMLAPKDFSIQKRPKGVRWLRFDSVIVNLGPGPFEAYGYQHPDDPAGILRTVQRIRGGAGDPAWSEHATPAVMSYSGDGHDHFHVQNLQEWTLTNSRAEVLRRGAKAGFCFWDNYRYGATSSAYYHPSTTSACDQRADGTVPMGLSVGWGDEYPSSIAFQYIVISGLPNGEYTITLKADAELAFAEADEGNNSSWARIRIERRGVTVLETSPAP